MQLCGVLTRKTPRLLTYVIIKGLNSMKYVELCIVSARAMCGKNSSIVTQILEVGKNTL